MPITRREWLLGAAATATLSGQTATAWQTSLNSWSGVRPRLLLTAQKLAAIRNSLTTTYAAMWNRVSFQTSLFRNTPPPAYTVSGSDDAQLWMRDNGDSMIYLALAYLLSGDASYLNDCKKFIQASCSYPAWGTGTGLNNNLTAAHQLFGLGIVYDWLQSALDSGTLTTIRTTLANRAPAMYAAAVDPQVSWSTHLLDKHKDICITGLATAAFALFDDAQLNPQALLWIGRCRSQMQQVQDFLTTDGASLEGVTYWDYGTQFALAFWSQSEALLGEKATSIHYTLGPFYRLYLTVPYSTWNFQNPVQMDLSDCVRQIWDGPSPAMRRMGVIGQTPVAQWYAASMASKGVDRYWDAWQNFIWYDPSLASQSPAGMPGAAPLRRYGNCCRAIGLVGQRIDCDIQVRRAVRSERISRLPAPNGEAGHAAPGRQPFYNFRQ